ncbi:MAG: DUF4363 family protein [Clostridia bacterium]|nr:DUF4363 family protein [Clostridia bacterium]
MRTFVIALLLLSLICGGLSLYGVYLDRESEALLSALSPLYDATIKEDWAHAESLLSALEALLEEKTPRLAVFTDHDILDDINETAARARGYAKCREAPECIAEIETLRAMIEHIPRREALTFYNIF